MIGAGLGWIGGTLGVVVAFVGLAPVAAGTFNVCLIAPLLKVPFSGRDALAK
jgi:hypothetical protein